MTTNSRNTAIRSLSFSFMASNDKKSKKIIESVQDLSKMRPDSTEMAKKSLQDLSQLKPKPDSGRKKKDSSADSGKSKK